MAISNSISITFQNDVITVKDTTGAYSASNTGGYGSPNAAASTFSFYVILTNRNIFNATGNASWKIYKATPCTNAGVTVNIPVLEDVYMMYFAMITNNISVPTGNIVTGDDQTISDYIRPITDANNPRVYIQDSVITSFLENLNRKESDQLINSSDNNIDLYVENQSLYIGMYTSAAKFNDAQTRKLFNILKNNYVECQC
jgi:hypothetical protein